MNPLRKMVEFSDMDMSAALMISASSMVTSSVFLMDANPSSFPSFFTQRGKSEARTGFSVKTLVNTAINAWACVSSRRLTNEGRRPVVTMPGWTPLMNLANSTRSAASDEEGGPMPGAKVVQESKFNSLPAALVLLEVGPKRRMFFPLANFATIFA